MLKLNNIKDTASQKKSKRVGRGIGSGKGKTSGAGHKGQKSRSGVSIKGFEGGQMPLHRRLPKRGFKNPFKKIYSIINIKQIENAIKEKKIDSTKDINSISLFDAGLIRKKTDEIKLLGNGKITHQISISVHKASKNAIAIVNKAKGKIILVNNIKPEKKTKAKSKQNIKEKKSSSNELVEKGKK